MNCKNVITTTTTRAQHSVPIAEEEAFESVNQLTTTSTLVYDRGNAVEYCTMH